MMRLLAALVIGSLTGCKQLPVRHIAVSPTVQVSPTGGVTLTGDAKTPTKADTSQTDSVLPIPEGSTFVFDEKKGLMTLTLSKASQLAVNRSETRVEGPVAFTPDKGATVGEELDAKAEAKVKLGLYAALVVGGALAVFGLVRGWDLVMYGGAAFSSAAALGLFWQRNPLIAGLAGAGVAAIVIGPLIWHTKLKPSVKRLDQSVDQE